MTCRVWLALLAVGLGAPACTYRAPFGDDRLSAVGSDRPAGSGTGGNGAGGAVGNTLSWLPRKTAHNLGPYSCAELAGGDYGCQSVVDWSSFVYDRARHQLLMFGGGDHSTARTDVSVFDFASWAWGSAYPPTACADMVSTNFDPARGAWISTGHPIARQTYDMLVMADSQLLMLTYNGGGGDCVQWPMAEAELEAAPGSVAHYDPDTARWSYSSAAANSWSPDAAAEYDPLSGQVIVLSDQGLWTYDPRAQVALQRLTFPSGAGLEYSAQLVYFPPNDRLYHFTRSGHVFEVALDRDVWESSTITELTNMTGALPAVDAKGWAFDEVNLVIGGGIRDGTFYAFEPTTRVWTSETMSVPAGAARPGNVSFYTLAYAARDGVFVFVTDYAGEYTTWAYRN